MKTQPERSTIRINRWTFSQSIADVDPAEWGGSLTEAQLRTQQKEDL